MPQLRKAEFQAVPGVGNPFVCTLLYAIHVPENESIKRALHYQIQSQFNAPNSFEDQQIGTNQRATIDNYVMDAQAGQPGLTVYPTSIKLINVDNELLGRFRALIHTNEAMGPFDRRFATQEIIITVMPNSNPDGFTSIDF